MKARRNGYRSSEDGVDGGCGYKKEVEGNGMEMKRKERGNEGRKWREERETEKLNS